MKKRYNIIFGCVFVAIVLVVTMIVKLNFKTENNNIIEEVSNNVIASQKKEKYNIYTYVTEETKEIAQNPSGVVCFEREFTPQFLKEICTDIAVIRVISLDYMDMDVSFFGMTFGKALVNNCIYGTIKEGDVITYMKPGGYVNMETYNNAQPEAERENRLMVREMYGITTPLSEEYMNILVNNDIEIEAGKTYLAYLTYNEKNKAYEIIGLERGLREVDIPKESEYVSVIDLDLEQVKILNNETGEYENMKEYIDNNINIY